MLNIKMLNLIVVVEALRPVTVEGHVAERRLCRRRRVITIVVVFVVEEVEDDAD